MKHSCRCGFEKHCKKLKARKLGKLGVLLVGLHLLYHVAECLILPTILIGASEYFAHRDSPTAAVEKALVVVTPGKSFSNPPHAKPCATPSPLSPPITSNLIHPHYYNKLRSGRIDILLGRLRGPGLAAYGWSSVVDASDITHAYDLGFTLSGIDSSDVSNRRTGFPLRCLARQQ